MRKSWKALAGVALAAALVAAPLTASAASADDGAGEEHNGYVLALWKADDVANTYPQTLVASVETVVQTLTALRTVRLEPCSRYQLELYADDATTDALIAAGKVASASEPAKSWPGGKKRFWFTSTWKTRCGEEADKVVTPTLTITEASCAAPGSVAGNTEGVAWAAVLNDDGTSTYTATPLEGYAFPVGAQTEFPVPSLTQLSGEGCPAPRDDTPVTADFDVLPTDATCDAAGSFDTSVFPIDRAGYTLTVDRDFDGPGEYTIMATPKSGFVLEHETSLVVHVEDRLPREACPSIIIDESPEAPTFTDACGTENDTFSVPEDDEFVSYGVDHEAGTVSVFAWPTVEGDSFGEGVVHEWSHTFTDEACPVPAAAPPTSSLAVTGSTGVSPLLPIGAVALVLAGLALAVTRKLAGR